LHRAHRERPALDPALRPAGRCRAGHRSSVSAGGWLCPPSLPSSLSSPSGRMVASPSGEMVGRELVFLRCPPVGQGRGLPTAVGPFQPEGGDKGGGAHTLLEAVGSHRKGCWEGCWKATEMFGGWWWASDGRLAGHLGGHSLEMG